MRATPSKALSVLAEIGLDSGAELPPQPRFIASTALCRWLADKCTYREVIRASLWPASAMRVGPLALRWPVAQERVPAIMQVAIGNPGAAGSAYEQH